MNMIEVEKGPEQRGRKRQRSTGFSMQQPPARSAISNDMNGSIVTLRTRGYRHNHDQKLFLIDFMEAHPEFAFGRYVGPRQKAQALWVQLTEEMNARGPKKTVAQWQKAWTDVKSRARVRVNSKVNHPDFDPVNDLDARVLVLLDSLSENSSNSNTASTSISTEHVACDSDLDEIHVPTNPLDFLPPLEAEILPPEMVLLPESVTEPEPLESCSIIEVKDDLDISDAHLDDGHLDDGRVDDHSSLYGAADVEQNFEQNGSYHDAMDSHNYNERSSYSSKNTRQNHEQRHNISILRNRLRRLPNRNVSIRPNASPAVSNTQRRQTETLEALSKAMLQNAENEKERNRLMVQSLDINRARLRAELERNDILRDLVSTLKGISQGKNQCLF